MTRSIWPAAEPRQSAGAAAWERRYRSLGDTHARPQSVPTLSRATRAPGAAWPASPRVLRSAIDGARRELCDLAHVGVPRGNSCRPAV